VLKIPKSTISSLEPPFSPMCKVGEKMMNYPLWPLLSRGMIQLQQCRLREQKVYIIDLPPPIFLQKQYIGVDIVHGM